jgi:hypothetical protein
VTVPRDYDEDPGRFLPGTAWPHDDVHPYVAARFAAPGRAGRRRQLTTLSTAGHAASFMRCHGMGERAAASAAATLDLPLSLTMRGCVVYATKG